MERPLTPLSWLLICCFDLVLLLSAISLPFKCHVEWRDRDNMNRRTYLIACNYCHAILSRSLPESKCFRVHLRSVLYLNCWKNESHLLLKHVLSVPFQSDIRDITFSFSCSWKYLSNRDSARRGWAVKPYHYANIFLFKWMCSTIYCRI